MPPNLSALQLSKVSLKYDVTVKISFKDIIKGISEVEVGASQLQTFDDIKDRVLEAINKSQPSEEIFDDIRVYRNPSMVRLFR